MKTVISADPPVNQAPPELDPAHDLPRGFYDFLLPLHRAFTPRQRELAARRRRVLDAAHQGRLPDYLPASEATTGSWKVSLPGWCQDQRNQMTGPADDAELQELIAQAADNPVLRDALLAVKRMNEARQQSRPPRRRDDQGNQRAG